MSCFKGIFCKQPLKKDTNRQEYPYTFSTKSLLLIVLYQVVSPEPCNDTSVISPEVALAVVCSIPSD
jgi:hypothetical protein